VAVIVLCVGILIFGGFTYTSMPRENFPEVKIPVVLVTTSFDGAAPADVETAITIPLETELDGVDGLSKLTSTSSESVSVIALEFEPDVDTQTAIQRTRDAVDTAKGDLPADAEEPVIKEFSIDEEHPVLVYNLVSGAAITLSELDNVAERIQDELELVSGVLEVKVRGGRDREILIEVDPDRLRYYGLSLIQVQGVLRGSNRNVSAGASVLPSTRLVMRAPGEFTTVGEIFELVVGAGQDGVPIYMKDVASVRYDFAEEKSRARLYDFAGEDGETPVNHYVEPAKSISIMVIKKTGSNVLKLIEDCHAASAALNLPGGVKLVVITDISSDIHSSVADLENGIGTALILVLLVIFFGLGARNSILVAWAIPFSMLLAIVIISAIGYTLNMIVLFSLIMALGMLVDNAIVIIENIYRHRCLGADRVQAALNGTSEMAWPVIASTATTVGAFLPMTLWPGIMGEFMSYMPRTVIIVLLCSLFVALVINPTMAALTMKVKKGAKLSIDPETEKPNYALAVHYGKALDFMLDRPLWTVGTSFLTLAVALMWFGVFGRGMEFFPTLDPKMVIVSITPPDGTSIEEINRLADAAEGRLFGREGSGFALPITNLKSVGVTLGIGGSGSTGPGALRIQFAHRDYWSEPTFNSLAQLRNRLEGLDREGNFVTHPLFGADYDVIVPEDGPPTGKPVSIDIYGEDLSVMTRVVGDMKRLMSTIDGVAKPSDDAATAQPTLEWRVDKARAGLVGLDQATVANTIKMTVGGLKTGTFGHGDDEQDIIVRLPQKYRTDTRRMELVGVPGPLNAATPITTVATAELVPGPVQIKHYGRKRVLTVGADLEPWVVADADIRATFQEKVEARAMPQGITYRFGGAAEEEEKSRVFLQEAFGIALFLIAMILVIQFNSVLIPLIVMCSVVLSFTGVFLGLIVFDKPFGIIMSGIGVISLAGIVVNNGIVLLDAIRRFEQRGLAVREAVVTAAMIRLRPVLLTAITTILGLLPMAAKVNIDFLNFAIQYNTESSQWWQSMAMVIIFGLLVSTVLTLGVVPALYLIYRRVAGAAARFTGSEKAAAS
jgi:multidrug efflux pump subunit AcrB